MVKKKEEPYNLNQIKCLETIWGEGFLSPGGKDEIDQVLDGFDLENMNVIDIGCGTGGAAFHISNHYGAKSVIGVDTGPMVIKRANELLNSNKADNVTFNVISPGPYEFEDNSFDAIFSKDTFIHIPDKENLCKELYRILKPGGFLAASDWMRRDDNPLSKQMYEYIQTEDLDMNMCSLSRYKDALLSSGFIDIILRDRNAWYFNIAKQEVRDIENKFYNKLVEGIGFEKTQETIYVWKKMLGVLEIGEHRPGHFSAIKPFI